MQGLSQWPHSRLTESAVLLLSHTLSAGAASHFQSTPLPRFRTVWGLHFLVSRQSRLQAEVWGFAFGLFGRPFLQKLVPYFMLSQWLYFHRGYQARLLCNGQGYGQGSLRRTSLASSHFSSGTVHTPPVQSESGYLDSQIVTRKIGSPFKPFKEPALQNQNNKINKTKNLASNFSEERIMC